MSGSVAQEPVPTAGSNQLSSVRRQETISLPLANSVKQRLLVTGHRTVQDFESATEHSLAQATGLPPAEVAEVLRQTHRVGRADGGVAGAVTADQLREQEARLPKITTYCSQLDSILGGGVQLGQITEFCGVPAIGKTQLGIQLALTVQIPACFGGAEGQAVYIDTEGSVVTDRVMEVGQAVLNNLQRQVDRATDPDARLLRQQQVATLSVQRLLSSIHYFRCRDIAEQQAAIKMLPGFLAQHLQVRLVVLDSIAFHYRHDLSDAGKRTRELMTLGGDLMRLAGQMKAAVVIINQVTTQIGEDGTMGKLVPALGDSWAHVATNRVLLLWRNSQRYAFLFKSPYLPSAEAEYLVTPAGIRGRPVQKRPREAQEVSAIADL